MKIMVIGLRGIPSIQGGIETHSEHLYPLLVELGCRVEVIIRSGATRVEHQKTWKGIKLTRLWSPKTTGVESFIHTFLAVIYAGVKRPDLLHIHAIGPAIMTPFARLLGLSVVVTHHGPDYEREKWGSLAKRVLYLGEKLGMKWANQRIVISKVIQTLVKNKYDLESNLISNGVIVHNIPNTWSTLDKFNLSKNQYIIHVSRIVPEKRHLDLIRAFKQTNSPEWKLVIVGKLNPTEKYTQALIEETKNDNNIIFTNFQSGLELKELLAHAGIFVLPSSHEGHPIALLEALSYGLRVIASDIPANLEINLPENQYFPLGDINQLSNLLQFFQQNLLNSNDRDKIREWVTNQFNWQTIAKQTLSVYESLDKKNNY